MNRYFRQIIWLLVGVILGLGGMLAADRLRGLPAPVLSMPEVGVYGPIRLNFARPVDVASVEAHFSLEPAVDGRLEWDGLTLLFRPDRPLQPGQTYTINLRAGIRGQGGLLLRRDVRLMVRVRPQTVIYLGGANQSPEVWQVAVDGSASRQLTHTGGQVYDFGASHDGEQIVYAARNSQGGMDLWLWQRADGAERRLLACGADWCTNPAWSPDGSLIAFSRRVVNGGRPGAPRIWTMDAGGGQAQVLYANAAVLGSEPSWSPDGSRLAFYDPAANAIRVLAVDSGRDVLLPSNQAMTGEWTPDGQGLLYITAGSTTLEATISVLQANLQAGGGTLLLNAAPEEAEYSLPAINPDGEWMVVGMRNLNGPPSKQLYLMKIDGSERRALTDNQVVTNAGYHWDAQGEMVVLQQLQLDSSSSRPVVLVWERRNGNFTPLAQDAAFPAWLP